MEINSCVVKPNDTVPAYLRRIFHTIECKEMILPGHGHGLEIRLKRLVHHNLRAIILPALTEGRLLLKMVAFCGENFLFFNIPGHWEQFAQKASLNAYAWIRIEAESIYCSELDSAPHARSVQTFEGRSDSLSFRPAITIDLTEVASLMQLQAPERSEEILLLEEHQEFFKNRKAKFGLSNLLGPDSRATAIAFFLNAAHSGLTLAAGSICDEDVEEHGRLLLVNMEPSGDPWDICDRVTVRPQINGQSIQRTFVMPELCFDLFKHHEGHECWIRDWNGMNVRIPAHRLTLELVK